MRDDQLRWVLLRTFFQSYRAFHELFDRYERRVLDFADTYGVDRKKLELPPDELHSLLDVGALEALRDGGLARLTEIAAHVFPGTLGPEPFASHVAHAYHEVSILREEHKTIGAEATRLDPTEYRRYYREVNVYYPRRLRHVEHLYAQARERLERLLPSMARNRVIVRSVYLFGDALVQGIYPGGLPELYDFMYPNGGAVTGYSIAADSFLEARFGPEAVEAYERALRTLDEELARHPADAAAEDRTAAILQGRRETLTEQLEAARTVA